ncbi:hypothetical protein [Maribacter antarcticus]|uniref:hypothetical protein n=1 Tax=Maribacter antarcticus TaxID=505250 RepID=UPI00047D6548|nr:hypothetical protein [Maribacter antarcticus]
MFLQKTNIQEKLARVKAKNPIGEEQVLNEVFAILNTLDEQHLRIKKSIANGGGALTNSFDFDLLESSKIFHVTDIKKICIDYRLRFLDSRYFKGEIPVEGISKIKSLEKEHKIELKGFKIIAPSKLFKLEDKDDPLLFAPIGNGYFYLIHQWGNDLHPLRKALMWPFKNIINLAVLVFAISFLVTLMVPEGLFSKSNSSVEFWILYFFMFKSIAAVVIFYGFALGKNFNPAIWNSKYFNA